MACGAEPIWFIAQASSGPSDAEHSSEPFLSGVILASEYLDEQDRVEEGSFELFVWIRPPHRSIGLGSSTVRDKIEAVVGMLPDGAVLKVRYPRPPANAQLDLEHAGWQRFFAGFGFGSIREDGPPDWTVMRHPPRPRKA
jgi:hypothetical protein